MNWKLWLFILLVALIGINNYTGGALLLNADQISLDQTGQSLGQLASCGIGNLLLSPVIDWNGIIIPIPALDDIIYVIILLTFTNIILGLFKKEISWKKYALLGVIYFILLKGIGFVLIGLAGQQCVELTKIASGLLSPLFLVLMILSIPSFLFFLYKKSRRK